jgi:hypothetical protein
MKVCVCVRVRACGWMGELRSGGLVCHSEKPVTDL